MNRALLLAPLQLAQAAVGFCAIALFTRLMSAEAFGRYALALSLSMLAHTLLFTWVEAAAFRFLPQLRSETAKSDHFATLLALAFALGAATFIAVALALQLVDFGQEAAALASFAAGAAFLRFLVRIARESDRAALDLHRYTIAEAGYLVLGFGGAVLALVSFDLGAAGPFAGLLLAGLVVAIWDAPRLFARAKGGRVDSARVLFYGGYGAPLALALCIDLAVQAASRLILADAAGVDAVGAYAAAFGLARTLDVAFMGLSAMLAPMVFNAFETSADAARDAARTMFVSFAALAAPGAAALVLTAPHLAGFMVGTPLSAETATALPWLAIAGLVGGFNLYYWSEPFQLLSRTGLRAIVLLAPAGAQVLLTIALAPFWGAAGAAAAALAGALLALVVLVATGSRLFAMPAPLGEIARICGGVMVMTVAMLTAQSAGLFATLAAGAGAYGGGALLFNVAGVRAFAWRKAAPFWARRRAHAH
ncbi:MAG: polysaccharide biosynthesis C-terminal domain-containing protein [Terricaulis sp.]